MTWLRTATGAALASCVLAMAACGSSGEPEPSDGGSSSMGGSTSGGATSNGGASSVGGSASGGATSSGGSGDDSGGSASGGRVGRGQGGSASGGKSSGGATSSGGKSAGTGGAATGGVTGGVVCGNRICPNNQECCNASCNRCVPAGMVCDQRACEPGSGGSGGGGACMTAADCRLVDDYCEGCNCRALATGDPDPVCTGTIVNCIIAPCENKSADCVNGRCVAVTGR